MSECPHTCHKCGKALTPEDQVPDRLDECRECYETALRALREEGQRA